MRVFTISGYPSTACRSAQFADELQQTLAFAAPTWRVHTCVVGDRAAVNDANDAIVVDRDDRASYALAGRRIVASAADLAIVHHDRDVWGGPNGRFILDLVSQFYGCGLPYALIVHDVGAASGADGCRTLALLGRNATRIVTFTRSARNLIRRLGEVEAECVVALPQGGPPALRHRFHPGSLRPSVSSALRRLRGTRLLTALGQTGADGGLEFAVAALRNVAERHRRAALLIVRAPTPAASSGPHSRRQLTRIAAGLGVQERVEFLEAELSPAELAAVLARTDLFLSPHVNANRHCSLPLTYALTAGRPVVATTYRYAVELLTTGGDQPGLLVPTGNAEALGSAIDQLLYDRRAQQSAQEAADRLGRNLLWTALGPRYVEVLAEAAQRALEPAIDTGPRLAAA